MQKKQSSDGIIAHRFDVRASPTVTLNSNLTEPSPKMRSSARYITLSQPPLSFFSSLDSGVLPIPSGSPPTQSAYVLSLDGWLRLQLPHSMSPNLVWTWLAWGLSEYFEGIAVLRRRQRVWPRREGNWNSYLGRKGGQCLEKLSNGNGCRHCWRANSGTSQAGKIFFRVTMSKLQSRVRKTSL